MGNKLVCPVVNFADQSATVSTTNSLLCVYHEDFGTNWNLSATDCFSFYGGAHLCRYEEIRRACINGGGFAPLNNSWLGDRSGDDSAVRTNGTNCNNFDGVSGVATNLTGKYCCVEWPKY